jgi:Toprim-like
MQLAEFLALFDGVLQRNGYYMAPCPAHEDPRQSLSIKGTPAGKILLNCHAGCLAPAIVAAKGVTMSDLFADAPDRRRRAPVQAVHSAIVATYDYEDEDCTVLYQAVRCEPKRFFQRQPAAGGQWRNSMEGARRVLYKLPDLLAMRRPRVLIVEGEKDADACWALGLPATTSVAGAGKWAGHAADYVAQLQAAGCQEVVLIPDNDEPGRTHMHAVAQSAVTAGLRVLWLELPVPPKGDVSDWLAAGGTTPELVDLIEHARAWPFRTTLADVHERFVKWLGEEYDLDVLDAVLSAAASQRLGGDPCWLMIVSGPGAAKTETVQPLEGAGGIMVSSISSEAALLSGTAKRERTSESTGGLLRRLGDSGLLIIKDMTSVLTMDRTNRGQILSALREIHDGSWYREVGADGGRVLTWEGTVVVIAACTTAWDVAHSVVAQMGDRFLLVRFDTTHGRESAFRQAMKNAGHEKAMRRELAEVVGELLATVDPATAPPANLSREQVTSLFNMANVVTRARTAVEQSYQLEVIEPHDPEMPTRLGKQLFQMVRGAVALGLAIADALALAARCARDSIPPMRLLVLEALEQLPKARVKHVADRINRPYMSVKRTLEALQTLGLVLREGEEKEATFDLASAVNILAIKKKSFTTNVDTQSGTSKTDRVTTSVVVEREPDFVRW